VGFTYPQPDKLDFYYPPNYRRYGQVTSSILKILYNLRVRRWVKRFERPGIALELGCGNGMMLYSLKQMGWRVVGIERSPEVAAFERQRLGLPIFAGGLESLVPKPCFDLIILFQVLEHMPDPLTTLKQCANLLNPSGKIIIGVPNLDSWQAKYAGPDWFHLDVPRHLFHFSPTSLQNALRLANLTVADFDYISIEHDPYGWIESILNKKRITTNIITRKLMRLDGVVSGGVEVYPLAGLLLVPSLLLSLVSWMRKAGALMQVTCEHPREAQK
jgi:SAM-dependent methyltransferase